MNILSILPILILQFLLVLACRTSIPRELSSPKIKNNFNKSNIPVVFVPGIKGSVLEDSEGNKKWLSAAQALNFSTPDLRLIGKTKELQAAGAIDRITAIPYIVDVALYGPWLEKMSEENEIDFYVFSYDWRKDNLNTRDALVKFLEKIESKYEKKTILVGHSMGGMISFSAINLKPKLVDKVVLVGVPFRGGIGYMKDLHSGVSIGLNSKIQSPCTIAKYETVYVFFPRLNSKDSTGLVEDINGKPIEIDFFKQSEWKKNSLGFYSNSCSTEEIPNDIEFQNILDRAKLFRNSLDLSNQLLKSPTNSLVINAKNRPTRKTFKEVSSEKKLWEMEALRVGGDGSVIYEQSLPQTGFSYKTIETENEHSVILNDPKVQTGILKFIKEN